VESKDITDHGPRTSDRTTLGRKEELRESGGKKSVEQVKPKPNNDGNKEHTVDTAGWETSKTQLIIIKIKIENTKKNNTLG